MIHIAVCDDDLSQCEHTKSLLKKFFEIRPEISVMISVYTSGEELLFSVEETGGFDLYILDIIMPQLNGIEAALQLRETDDLGQIIYLTSAPEYAVESYKTHAFHYLLKPIQEDMFFSVMEKILFLIQQRKSNTITVKTADAVQNISLDQILYVELVGRCAYYHLTDSSVIKSTTLRITFAEAVAPLLLDTRFILCGASFAINLHHVVAIDKQNIMFNNDIRIHPPKKSIPLVRTKWMNYWFEGAS